MVAFWFIESARPLRFYVLFVGTMSALYALYDIMDGKQASSLLALG
jgi:hypothetical protein